MVIMTFLSMSNLSEQFWIPPDGESFFQLDASDESWARPLGLGTVMTWAQFVEYMNKKLDQQIYRSLSIPARLLSDSEIGSYSIVW